MHKSENKGNVTPVSYKPIGEDGGITPNRNSLDLDTQVPVTTPSSHRK